MAKQIKQKDIIVDDVWGKAIKSTEELLNVVNKLDEQLIKLGKDAKTALKFTGNEDFKKVSKLNENVNNTNKLYNKKLEIDKERIRLERQLDKLNSTRINKNTILKEQIREQNKANREAARATLNLTTEYQKQSKRLTELRNKAKDLGIQFGLNSKEFRTAQKEVVKLDRDLKKLDSSLGQSQRQVGRYERALGGLKNILGAAGIVGGVQLFARVIRDSFQRIRDFDKELTNIASVSGSTRDELKDLERVIVSVAGSSIKTSNEVAQLATVLITLGKTKEEVKLLLKPVNDLSIALGATSEETADFLGQTLNAFGRGAESGQEFADVIAKVRSSTSLDFERIKDAFGFIAPTANALGLTLGETSALIGVLQDNGIKAARAGRLLSSSFARLATDGISLDEALQQINDSQDKVVTSSNLFGAESFTLGLILADNTDKVAKLANEFDNLSQGSLKELTDKQLESLDAKIKILDSTFESFLLNIENGQGTLSTLFKDVIVGATELIELIGLINDPVNSITKIGADAVDRLKIETTTEAIKEFKNFLEVTNQVNQSEEDRIATIERFLEVDKNRLEILRGRQKNGQQLSKTELDSIIILKARISAVESVNVAEKEQSENLKEIKKTQDGINKKEKIDLIDNENITKLEDLKSQLKEIEQLREGLVNKTDSESKRAFNELTIQAEQLGNIIQIYEDRLKGVERDIPKEQKDLFDKLNKQRNDDFKQQLADADERRQEEVDADLKAEQEKAANRQRTLDVTQALVDRQFEERLRLADQEVEVQKQRQGELQSLAAQGNADAAASLAENQKKQAQAEQQKQDLLQKQKQFELALAVVNAFNSELDANPSGGSSAALAKAITSTTVLTSFVSSLPAFKDGTEDTGKGGGLDGYGGFHAILHPNERVLTKEQNSKIGGLKNEDVANVMDSYNKGLLVDLDRHNSPKLEFKAKPYDTNEQLIKRFEQFEKSIVNAINNKEAYLGSDIDTIKQVITKTFKKGNKVVKQSSRSPKL